MIKRIEKILDLIPKTNTFADIGCDHGYVTKFLIESGKCERAIVSDISPKCLKKAEILLKKEIEKGIVKSVVSDGFANVTKADTALIAGLGGEEIIKILSVDNLPNTLILQPMKNCEKIREFVVKIGYKIEKDYIFYAEKKYYNLMLITRGKDELTKEEILFGRTNINEKPQDFISYVNEEIVKFKERLNAPNLSEENRKILTEKIKGLSKYAN